MAFGLFISTADGELGRAISVDGTLREDLTDTSVLTSFPVGRGAISDSVIHSQPVATVDIIVTESPNIGTKDFYVPNFVVQQVTRKVGDVELVSFEPSRKLSPFERATAFYNILLELQKETRVLVLDTALRRIPRCVITRITVPIESSRGEVIFTVDFQAFRTATSRVTSDVVVEAPRNSSENDSGTQTADTEVTEDDPAAQSFFSAVTGG